MKGLRYVTVRSVRPVFGYITYYNTLRYGTLCFVMLCHAKLHYIMPMLRHVVTINYGRSMLRYIRPTLDYFMPVLCYILPTLGLRYITLHYVVLCYVT